MARLVNGRRLFKERARRPGLTNGSHAIGAWFHPAFPFAWRGGGGGVGGRDGVSGMGSFKLTEEASLVDLKGLVRITLAAIQGV